MSLYLRQNPPYTELVHFWQLMFGCCLLSALCFWIVAFLCRARPAQFIIKNPVLRYRNVGIMQLSILLFSSRQGITMSHVASSNECNSKSEQVAVCTHWNRHKIWKIVSQSPQFFWSLIFCSIWSPHTTINSLRLLSFAHVSFFLLFFLVVGGRGGGVWNVLLMVAISWLVNRGNPGYQSILVL